MSDVRLRQLGEEDLDHVARRDAEAFGTATDDRRRERHRSDIDRGVLVGLDVDGSIVAQCRLLPTEHWFGGRRVPCLDIGAVAVAPADRGRGHASQLMTLAVQRGAGEGYGLSLLFPATSALYRKLGWEHAGSHATVAVQTRHVPRTGDTLRVADRPTDWAAVARCWDRFAAAHAGPARRGDARWEALARAAHRYVLDDPDAPGEVVAYALVDHRRIPGDWRYELVVRDWAATTPAGFRAVVGFLGGHGTVAASARLIDAVPHRLGLWVPEQDVDLRSDFWWMARGLDLSRAVAARGWPSAVSITVTLRVHDPLLPSADRPLRLDVSGGEGSLTDAAGADVELDARAVGPLYTGFRSPHELASAGLLRGPAASLDYLAAAFAGPTPTLFQFF